MSAFLRDLQHSLRLLHKQPAFTVVAILILALGIGANTAMFSVINTLLFKPLAAEAPSELVRVFSRDARPEGGYRSFSYPNYTDLRAENTCFTELAGFTTSMVGVRDGDTTRRVFTKSVTANYFRTFGVRPVMGRDFLPEEERPGAGVRVAIVSDRFWRRQGADPGIIGRTMQFSGQPFEIIGVAPAGFTGIMALFSPDVFVPLGAHAWLANDFNQERRRSLAERDYHLLMLVGRLKPGFTAADAETQLQPLATRLAEAHPRENRDQSFVVTPPARLSLNTNPQNEGEIRFLAALLLPMAGVILLIACLNLANLLLARGATRQREFAIRSALGGGRRQIVRQLLIEGLVLALLGGLLALPLSGWSTSLLVQSLGAKLPFMTIVFDARPDARVLAATSLFCLLATLFSSLMPALRLSKVDLIRDLKEQGGAGSQDLKGFGPRSLRGLLVTGQIALSFVLLAVAGLFYRGALNAAHSDPGFRFERGVLAELDASLAGYDEAKARRVYQAALERVRALPGVESASLASSIPFGVFSDGRQIHRPGASERLKQPREAPSEAALARVATDSATTPQGDNDRPFFASYAIVSDGYFKSLGTTMLQGREFDALEAGGTGTARVAILDDVAAKRLWSNPSDAVGSQIEIVDTNPDSQPLVLTVVGLAPSFRTQLGDDRPTPHLYVPTGQAFQAWMNLHVRVSSGDAGADRGLLGTVRRALHQVDEQLPVLSLNTLGDFHNDGLMMWLFRAGTRIFLAFGLLALLLAVAGVYGLKAFVVARRTREIGIRLALGATMGQVVWMVVRDGLKLTGIGLAVGLPLALAVGQLLRSALYRVNGADPLVFATATVVLTLAALLASYLPARRASALPPMNALRSE